MKLFEIKNTKGRVGVVASKSENAVRQFALRDRFCRKTHTLKVKQRFQYDLFMGAGVKELDRLLGYGFEGRLVIDSAGHLRQWVIANEHNDRLHSEWFRP